MKFKSFIHLTEANTMNEAKSFVESYIEMMGRENSLQGFSAEWPGP